eukprot:09632.XXX_412802_413059_1 [CDS] Oithona nana genome sequencing.
MLYAKIQCVKSKEEKKGAAISRKNHSSLPSKLHSSEAFTRTVIALDLPAKQNFLLPTIPPPSAIRRECANIFHQLNGDAIPRHYF